MEFEASTDRALLFVACYSVPHLFFVTCVISCNDNNNNNNNDNDNNSLGQKK